MTKKGNRPEELGKGIQLYSGDCLSCLDQIDENSVDSCVTDPPYHLTSIIKRFGNEKSLMSAQTIGNSANTPFKRTAKGFMGKQWDGGDVAFKKETWAKVYRTLKPGAHLVAFGGDRNYHRLACAIEDAGFEVRGSLAFLYGSGFPKSHDVGKKLDATQERCTCSTNLRDLRDSLDSEESFSSSTKQNMRPVLRRQECVEKKNGCDKKTAHNLRSLQGTSEGPSTVKTSKTESRLLQLQLSSAGNNDSDTGKTRSQRQSSVDRSQHDFILRENDRPEQPSVEGRRHLSQETRQLRKRKIREVPKGFAENGKSGRLRNGTSSGGSTMDSTASDADGMRTSSRSQSTQQQTKKLRTMAMQSQPQKRGAWDCCDRCGKPMVPDGLGTALKPAMELVCLARKPLSEKSVAANVLKWGTGALNIDGCRVEGYEREPKIIDDRKNGNTWHEGATGLRKKYLNKGATGRWPANVVHDGSDEVRKGFPETKSGEILPHHQAKGASKIGTFDIRDRTGETHPTYGDEGSAARFFYAAKPDRKGQPKSRLVKASKARGVSLSGSVDGSLRKEFYYDASKGRWPANVTHDGSAEVLEGFPESDHARGNIGSAKGGGGMYGHGETTNDFGAGDNGSAARFFYTAKADADERVGSDHPTVKPVDLMQWLVRLVTPPDGLVLDPFAGTGTTGEAAHREKRKAVLIEKEATYQQAIRDRVHVMKEGQYAREVAKMKRKKPSLGALFK